MILVFTATGTSSSQEEIKKAVEKFRTGHQPMPTLFVDHTVNPNQYKLLGEFEEEDLRQALPDDVTINIQAPA